MKVLLSFAVLAVATAGIIAHPFGGLGYGRGFFSPLVPTYFPRTYLPSYPGSYSYQFLLNPSPFTPSIIPGSVILATIPSISPFPSLQPRKGDSDDDDDDDNDDDNDDNEEEEDDADKEKDKKNKKNKKDKKKKKKNKNDGKDNMTKKSKDDKEDDKDEDKNSEVEDLRE